MSKLNILMLNHEFPPVGGGGARVTGELCRHLAGLGHRVDVVTMHFRGTARYECTDKVHVYRTPALRARADVCHTHELATYLPGALPRVLQLVRRRRYDIIHCHFMVPGGPLAWLVSKLTGIPFIVTCHGTDVPGHNPDRFGFVHKLIGPAWRYLARKTPLLTSPSGFLRDSIIRHCPQARVRVIPNGIEVNAFSPTEKNKSILMCSRVFAFKGFQHVIQAVKDQALEWHVHIIGDGPYLPQLKALAQGSRTPITFWGWLDKDDTRFRRLFNESAIFVFPSRAENFPTVLLEAMAAGMAIITSNAGGCMEIVADAGLAVAPGDVAAIREALKKLMDSPDLRNQLAAAAQERIKLFTWERIAGLFVETYEEVIRSVGR